jgi:3-deoxy-D-manno-octulosonate 8-phosphate phosphatase KdsC-like HAD superfamily phosphatase
MFLADGDVCRWENNIEMDATGRGVKAFRVGDGQLLRELVTELSCFTKAESSTVKQKIPIAGIYYLFNHLVTNWKMFALALVRAGSLYIRRSENNSHRFTAVYSTCTGCLAK